jgi:hypothetical protein
MTVNHFEAIVKANQLTRKPTPESLLTYDQIAYGIELDIVTRSQYLPASKFKDPLVEYKNAYLDRFQSLDPTSTSWASFLVDYFEARPSEIKTIAASRKPPSIYGRVYPHIRFWHLVVTFIGALLLVWVTVAA